MTREELINRIAESEDSHFDRETLEGFTDHQLAEVANESEVNLTDEESDEAGGEEEDESQEPQQNAAGEAERPVALEDLPEEVRDVVREHREERENEEETLRARLRSNEDCRISDEVLETMNLEQLREVQSQFGRRFLGAGGSRTRDASGEDGEDWYDRNPRPRPVVLADPDGEAPESEEPAAVKGGRA